MLIAGILYFTVKFLVKCHLMLNLYKAEIASSGKLIHNVCNKVIFLLIFYQLAATISIASRRHFVIVGVLVVTIIFTFITYILFKKHNLLRTELFIEQDFDIEGDHINRWRKTYQHPVKHLYDKNKGTLKGLEFSNNGSELELKSLYSDEDLKNLNMPTYKIEDDK